MSSAMIFQIQSFLIMSIMIYGALIHKKRDLHVKVMSFSMIWDVLLILQIELSRSAINKAVQITTSTTLLKIHLFFAISSVLLYIAMVISGRKLLAGDHSIRQKHKNLGRLTLLFRVLTFATSFFAVSPQA